jgi:hypothetical protein
MTRTEILLLSAWAALLGLVLALPALTASATPGEDLTRHTVRVALLFYAVASVLMLSLTPGEWAAEGRGRAARLCWTLAWLAYLIHLGMAMHHYHGWSHADAVRHVRERSGVGEGIFVSHAFTLFWTLDVAACWLRPRRYAARSVWLDRLLHGFMAFMVFNGTVVYEQGFIRWAGVALFAVLVPLWLWRAGRGTAFRYTDHSAPDAPVA